VPSPNLSQKLLETFSSCCAEERALIQLLSVIYAPVSKNVLLNIVRRNHRAPGGRSYTGLLLAESLEKLSRQKLVLLTKEGIRCNTEIMHAATLSAIEDNAFRIMTMAVQSEIPMETDWGSSYYRTQLHALRDVRIAFYAGNEKLAFEMEARFKRQFPYDLLRCHPFVTICNNPFDDRWFRSLPHGLQAAALKEILAHSSAHLSPAEGPFQVLCDLAAKRAIAQELYDMLCVELLLRGKISDAEKAAGEMTSSTEVAVLGWCMLLRGSCQGAVGLFETALAQLKKETGKRKTFFDSAAGPFFILALIGSGDEKLIAQAMDHCSFVVSKKEWPHRELYLILNPVAAGRSGERDTKPLLETLSHGPGFVNSPLYALFSVLSLAWCGSDKAPQKAEKLPAVARKAREAGYLWLADELDQTAIACGLSPLSAKALEKRYATHGLVPLVAAVKKIEFWETALKALIRLKSPDDQAPQKPASHSRLIWHFEELRGYFEIHPREQKQTPSGKWSAGRNVSLKRLSREGVPDRAGQDHLQLHQA